MAVDTLLSRLSGLKATGRDSWIARCPAHEDRTPSLTVRSLADGRILVHCFAGCGASDVVESLGLTLSDLFPEPLGQFRPVDVPFTAYDALRALRGESAVIAFAASDIVEGRALSAKDADRVALATGRIADALEYVNAR